MMRTYGLGCDAVSDVVTDVPVLVAFFVMVVVSTRLRNPEVLNLHHYHFEKPKSCKFFSKMYADGNNRVRFSHPSTLMIEAGGSDHLKLWCASVRLHGATSQN